MREMRSGFSGCPCAQLWVIILFEYTYPTWHAFARRVAGTDAALGRGSGTEPGERALDEPGWLSTSVLSAASVPLDCMLAVEEKEGIMSCDCQLPR